MNALDCFENDFFGNKGILSGSVLYMWVALCKKLFDVLAESDLYFTDGLQTWQSMFDLTRLWYNNWDNDWGCDSYEILWISMTDLCIIIW